MKHYVYNTSSGNRRSDGSLRPGVPWIVRSGLGGLVPADHPAVLRAGHVGGPFVEIEVTHPEMCIAEDTMAIRMYSQAERIQMQVLRRLVAVRDEWSKRDA